MDLIEMLIEYGATTLVKDINDEYIIFQLITNPTLLKDIIEIESQSPNKKQLILTLHNKQGNSLFMEFCRLGYIKLAKFMLKHRVELNYVNRGENALTLAVREGQLEIVKLLLTCRSIDIHHITNDGKTALRMAIENQNIPIIRALINHGGSLLLKNENENLLKNAINTSNIDIIKLLLDININIDVKFGYEKNTPLIYTIKKLMKDMNIDISDDDVDYKKQFNGTADSNSHSDVFKNDDDRMSISSNGSSNSSIVTLAQNKGITITDNNYYSRVFSNMDIEDGKDNSGAIYDSDDTLSETEDFDDSFNYTKDDLAEENDISSLNDSKKSTDKPDTESLPPSPTRKNLINTDIPELNHKVSFDRNYKVKDCSVEVDDQYCALIKALLYYRAKVNLTNEAKDNALILACRYGLRNVVEILMTESRQFNLDLDLNMVDRFGNTALHNACKKNYTSIVRLLVADESLNVNIQNQNGNSALMIAVYENNIEIIHELLKCSNININSLNVQLETPLIAACRMNNYKVAKILLDHKAIINKRYDLNGETAIFHSIRNNNKKLTSLLLENEASIAFKNKKGKSPLAIAKEYKYKGIVSLLFIHLKNQSALKNKTSTLSLNENILRNEDKKAFHSLKSHSRNASLNISPSSSSNNLSYINELKNNNTPSLKVNHNRNDSVTFSRNFANSSAPLPNGYVNNRHTRHESFNEDIINRSPVNATGNHIRHRSSNTEFISTKTSKFEKYSSKVDSNGQNNSEEENGKGKYKSKKVQGELRHIRSYSNNSLDHPTKKNSNYNMKKSYNITKTKSFDESQSDEESDTDITTNLLIMKAKEKVLSDYNGTTTTPFKTIKHSKSQSSLKGEPKPDDYLKPLKTACYNQNNEEVEKFFENLIQEKGNIYNLPDDLFQQLKDCTTENERAAFIEKVKAFNKTRESTPTVQSIDMYVFTLLYFSDNAKAIEIMLNYGLNPNMQNNAMYTLLILACKKSQTKSALVLLDYNADPNYQNKYDETALILACKKGLTDVIEKLIECKADVNLRNDKGETALIMACWKKNLNIVKKLLETDVDVNMKNSLEESPLYLSCLQNSLDIAEILLQHGADVNTANKNNETPLMVARKNNNTEMIQLLLKYGAK